LEPNTKSIAYWLLEEALIVCPPVVNVLDAASFAYVPLRSGISVVTSERNVGATAPPEVGPAQTWFALCVASVPVSVPDVVTGEPETVKIPGRERPTEVTVPALPLPDEAAVTRP
jgi:hypothetical protein